MFMLCFIFLVLMELCLVVYKYSIDTDRALNGGAILAKSQKYISLELHSTTSKRATISNLMSIKLFCCLGSYQRRKGVSP